MLAHPNLPSCHECERFVYNTDTWEPQYFRGKPARRAPGQKPPCERCPKVKQEREKTPEAGRRNELSARNWRALQRYYEMKACGGEVDALARRNNGIIEQLTSLIGTQQASAILQAMAARPL